MSRWFRMYDDIVNDPKVLCLSSDTLRWQWVALLCIASKNGGVLPAVTHVAITLRLVPHRAAAVLAELCAAGLLDKNDDGTFIPHNWDGRQYKSDVTDPTAAQRMKRYRDNRRNDRNATVTVIRPDTDTDTEAETEQKSSSNELDYSAAPAPRASRKKPKRSIPDGFEVAGPNVSYAKSLGFSDFEIKREHQKFCMNAKANARSYSDWNAAEHNWFTKAAEFAGKRPRGEWDAPEDGMIEVLDQIALEAWDAHSFKTTGKRFPRNKKGGWRFPTKFPPGYEQRIIADVEQLAFGKSILATGK